MKLYLNKALNYVVVLLFLVTPFLNSLANILLIICTAITGVNLYLNKTKIYLNYPLYTFILIFLYSIINFSLQGSFEDNNKFWRFIPILLFGFLSVSQLNNIDIKKIQKISIFSCFLFILIIIVKTLIFYYHNSHLPFGNGEQVNDILIIDRPYLGFYIVINILLSFDFFIKEKKNAYLIIIIGLTIFLILILARLSILTLIIISVIYSIFYTKFNIITKFLVLLAIISSILLLVIINPNTKERLNIENHEVFIDNEPRFVIWESAINIAKSNSFNKLTGYGDSKLIENLLVKEYRSNINNISKRDYYVNERFNTHSQYLDMFLMGGYPLLILFISFLISLIIFFKNDYLSSLILLSFILFFAVENVFARQFGCLLFTLYIGIYVVRNHNRSVIQKSSK